MRCWAARVPMYVGQALLQDPKYRQLQVARNAIKVWGNLNSGRKFRLAGKNSVAIWSQFAPKSSNGVEWSQIRMPRH
jgi:hypothetical protein